MLRHERVEPLRRVCAAQREPWVARPQTRQGFRAIQRAVSARARAARRAPVPSRGHDRVHVVAWRRLVDAPPSAGVPGDRVRGVLREFRVVGQRQAALDDRGVQAHAGRAHSDIGLRKLDDRRRRDVLHGRSGFVRDYGREILSQMAACGLREVRGEARARIIGSGSPGYDFFRLSFESLREGTVAAGLLSRADAESASAGFAGTELRVFTPMMVAGIGRGPE